MFERVVAARLNARLSGGGPKFGLAENQFGFCEGRSTLDAVRRVRSLAEKSVAWEGVALAGSLDIANASTPFPGRQLCGGSIVIESPHT